MDKGKAVQQYQPVEQNAEIVHNDKQSGNMENQESNDPHVKNITENLSSSNSDSDVPGVTVETKKRKKRSEVWSEMVETIENGVLKSKCIHCGKLFSVTKGGPTSTLGRHLKYKCHIKLRTKGQKLLQFGKNAAGDKHRQFLSSLNKNRGAQEDRMSELDIT